MQIRDFNPNGMKGGLIRIRIKSQEARSKSQESRCKNQEQRAKTEEIRVKTEDTRFKTGEAATPPLIPFNLWN